MGGLLFNTPRLPLKEFKKFKDDIEFVMDFAGIEYKIPLYFREKKDFGDLDVLIKSTVPTEMLLSIFKGYESHYDSSEKTVSFNYKNFQIDFIKIIPEDFNIAYHYFSYNDMGNLIGQLAKSVYLKFGEDGLKYVHTVGSQKRATISISKNIDEILKFINLDPAKYRSGFDTLQEIFDFITSSKYFNPYVSDLEPYGYSAAGVALYRLNKMNRERNAKRKTYQEWLEYIKKFKTGEENYKFREGTLDEAIDLVDKFFAGVNLREKLNFLNSEEEARKIMKTKFNGNIIVDLLPDLDKSDRQFFIDSFKDHVKSKVPYTFDEYIVKAKSEAIKKDIIDYYNNTFKKRFQ